MSFSIIEINMKKEIIFQYFKALEKLKDEEYLKAVISYYIAPVIEGKKPASIISLGSGGRNLKFLWQKYFDSFQENSDIKWITLRESTNSIIILIYNITVLKELLEREEIRDFFKDYGYKHYEIEGLLNDIKGKYKDNCPHEIGVLLGIPLKDVKAFVSGYKTPLIKSGYWLVYSEVEEALRTFDLYDSIREKVAMKIIREANKDNY